MQLSSLEDIEELNAWKKHENQIYTNFKRKSTYKKQ